MINLQNRQLFEEIQKRNAKRDSELASSPNNCRVCDKDLSIDGPKVNDHLMNNELNASPVDSAICMKCADKNPDEHFTEFKKKIGVNKNGI